MFNKRIQETGESVDYFVTDVIKLVKYRQYGDLKGDLIIDKLVSGIRHIREKLPIGMLRTTQTIKCYLKDMGGLATYWTLDGNYSWSVSPSLISYVLC